MKSLPVLKKFLSCNNFFKSRIFQLAFAILVLQFIASFFSVAVLASFATFTKYLIYFVTFTIFCYLFQRLKEKEELMGFIISIAQFLVAFATAISAYGIYQYYSGVEQLASWDDASVLANSTRIYSIFQNPNLLGAFLLSVMPINFALLRFSQKGFQQNLINLALLINASALIMTGSRSALISFAIVFFVFLVFDLFFSQEPSFRTKLFYCLPLSLLITYFLFFSELQLITRMETIGAGADYSTNDCRLKIWSGVWQMIQDHLFIGIGLGSEVFQKIQALYIKLDYQALASYSVYLQYWLEIGTMGFCLFLAFIFNIFVVLWNISGSVIRPTTLSQLKIAELQLNKDCGYLHKVFMVMFLSFFLGVFAQAMVDTLFFRPVIQVIFWLFVAIIVTLESRD